MNIDEMRTIEAAGPEGVENEPERRYTWSEGSFALAGVCTCGDFSCLGDQGEPCVNSDP